MHKQTAFFPDFFPDFGSGRSSACTGGVQPRVATRNRREVYAARLSAASMGPAYTLIWAAFALMLAMASAAGRAAELEVGDMAPDFTLQASDGETYTLADFRGKQAVVLAWFPRAFTSGCTVECKSLAENGERIRNFDVSYFMASTDPVEKNSEFAADTGADFPLLSDPEGTTAKAYGVFTRGFARRHTFYIDVDGRITHIDRDVKPSTSAEDMIANLEKLEVARRES